MVHITMNYNFGLIQQNVKCLRKTKSKKIGWSPFLINSINFMILKLKPIDVKRFNASQYKFRSQWLNIIPCKILRLK